LTQAAADLRLSAFLPYRLSIAANAVSDVIAGAYARQFRLSIPEWRLIAVLKEAGEATQQELVARTRMDKVTVSRAAQRLAKRSLIARRVDDQDARARRVALTDAGIALHAAVAPTALAYERSLLAGFEPEERETLTAMLERLTEAADALGA
jgi:DNA-binding MarR family transcriptional regulator